MEEMLDELNQVKGPTYKSRIMIHRFGDIPITFLDPIAVIKPTAENPFWTIHLKDRVVQTTESVIYDFIQGEEKS